MSADQREDHGTHLLLTEESRPFVPLCSVPTACAGRDAGVATDLLAHEFTR
jgi:hypothetical protein